MWREGSLATWDKTTLDWPVFPDQLTLRMWLSRYRLFATAAAITTGGLVAAGQNGCSLRRQRKQEESCECKRKYLEFHNDLLWLSLREVGTTADLPCCSWASENALNPKIIFEIEDRTPIVEARR
jgi:hypothetical protein